MDALINVIKKDLKVRAKINDMSDRYMRRPYNYQLKIRDRSCLIFSIIFKRMIYLF